MKNAEDDIFDAAYKNDFERISRLINQGLDPNDQHVRAGTLPLQVACQADALDAIHALLEGGADPRKCFTRKSRVDGRIFERHVPLMYATSVEAARILIDAGAHLDDADGRGWTPLVYAAHAGNVQLFDFYVERGARLDVLFDYDGRRVSLLEMIKMRIDDLKESKGRDAMILLSFDELEMRVRGGEGV